MFWRNENGSITLTRITITLHGNIKLNYAISSIQLNTDDVTLIVSTESDLQIGIHSFINIYTDFNIAISTQ